MSTNIRIGHGYDLHRLVPGRKLILAGVRIPHELGLHGHSDADVVIHAFIDSLLGAAGLGDIGRLYPDTDPVFKDADSMKLLQDVLTRLWQTTWQFNDSSITIIAQKPKLAPYIGQMEENLINAVGCEPGSIRIKAKTNENVGPEGREEAISVHVVTLVSKRQ